jgi:very-short-patch-repair endonuclease
MSAEKATGVMVDFLWKEQRLAVQVDGPDQSDRNLNERAADLALEAAGYRVLHISEQEFEEEPDRIAELLRRELEAGGWDGCPSHEGSRDHIPQ